MADPNVPEWAYHRADELLGDDTHYRNAFARYIASKEEAPVAKGPHLDLTYATKEQLSNWLRDAASNVEAAMMRNLAGYVAGWEPRLMRKAAELLAAKQ